MKARSSKIISMTYMALFVAVLAVISQLSIPIGAVPLTLQICVVAFCGYFLGLRRGTLAIILYIAIGAIGAPVFAGFKGGFFVLLGPSGGFVWGFIVVALFCGIWKRAQLAILGGIIGTLLCHLIGVIQYMLIASCSFWVSLVAVSLPYIIKDIILVPLAYFLAQKTKKHIKKNGW